MNAQSRTEVKLNLRRYGDYEIAFGVSQLDERIRLCWAHSRLKHAFQGGVGAECRFGVSTAHRANVSLEKFYPQVGQL